MTPDAKAKPTQSEPERAAVPTECPVCSRRLNDAGFCQHCGHQDREDRS